jgi:hypothetical protein
MALRVALMLLVVPATDCELISVAAEPESHNLIAQVRWWLYPFLDYTQMKGSVSALDLSGTATTH